ncbi:MAG: amidohydrolase [Clostridia bacterium]|nr:amidohydrolase [Clostridia bacterium]
MRGSRKVIDSHAHVVQYIAGTGAGGELRSIGNGMALYANGQIVRMIPEQFGGECVTPEHLLQVMDENRVERAVLLQGNFYGFQNYYTHQAVRQYPDRFAGAASYDPFSRDKEGIRRYLFEELGFTIEKFEVSTGSGLMAIHSVFRLDGEIMDDACSYACEQGHVFVIDIGKCGSDSWQIPELRNLVRRYPDMKFVACHLLAPSDKDEEKLSRALAMLQLPNLWFDLSSVVHNIRPDKYPYPKALKYIEMAKQIVGADKLMFGTDMPSALKEDTYDRYISYIDESDIFTEQEKNMIFYENAYNVYFNHK